MEKLKNALKKKVYIHFWIGLLLTFLLSIITTHLVLYLSGDADTYSLFISNENYIFNFMKNFVPIFFIFIILYLITNNFIFTNGFLMVFFCFIAFLNSVKVFYRGAPLYYYDFLLINEVMGIAKSLDIRLIIFVAIAIVFAVLFVVALAYFIKTEKLNIKYRVTLSAVLCIVLMIINATVLTSTEGYNNTEVADNKFSPVAQYNTKGFMYSFLYNFNNRNIRSKVSLDLTINEENINEYEKSADSIDTSQLPVIIMIQSEAFSELGINDKINFDNYIDPYKNYKEIIAQSYHGEIVVPNYGGGTSDAEFDVLTGMSTRFLRHAPYANQLINKEADAIPSMLKKLGYYTVAMHPGDSWFYDRQNTFNYFGFDEFIHIDSFDKTDVKGMYITEKQTFNSIINSYKDFVKKEKDLPYFSFNITIQNHGPFAGKYMAEQNFDTELNFYSSELNSLSNFFEGVHDIDVELKKLVDFFEKEERPVVVVYWSDHQPHMPYGVYDKLNKPKDELDMFRKYYNDFITPFFIWENSTSKKSHGVVEKLNSRNIGNPISDFYLSSLLFDALGFYGLSYYIDFNNDMLEDYPIILEESFYDEGSFFSPIDDNETINYYRNLTFFRLYGSNK